jgi:Tetratricopeptide repeat
MKNKSPHIFATLVFLLVVGGYLFIAMRYPMAYIWATYEDLFGEWVQFWCFVLALVFSVRLVFARSGYRMFFAALAMACFYVAMEEISWGQRIFGFETTEFFKTKNLQGEMNLHNMLTGPVSTPLKAALEYATAALLVGFGVLYPIATVLKIPPTSWLDRMGLPAPPFYLWPLFAVAGFCELGRVGFNEGEVAEVLVGLALVLFTAHYAFAHARSLAIHDTTEWPAGSSAALTKRSAIATLVVINLAVVTTLAIYATPSGKKRADNRIANGVEKFAGRYAKYKLWDVAASLYQRKLDREPKSAFTHRKLAECAAELGDEEKREEHLRVAIEIDLARYRKRPTSAKANRSLVRTYRLLGDNTNANKHASEALQIGLDRVKAKPDSAAAAYSLGETYKLVGMKTEALEQYKRATQLKPTSKKYRKAYLRLKH